MFCTPFASNWIESRSASHSANKAQMNKIIIPCGEGIIRINYDVTT